MSFDPVERHHYIRRLVVEERENGEYRRYYRFRPARWYGGVFTGDCAGCGLLCRFCWLSDRALYKPGSIGRLYSPSHVAERLVIGAESRGYHKVRLSGGEPTISMSHLLDVLDRLDGKIPLFILETNGILIGSSEDYAAALSKYKFIHVRVSIKGCSGEEFHKLTGADEEGFKIQLNSLRHLVKHGIACHPSVVASFSTQKAFKSLLDELEAINPQLKMNVEVEELIPYPHVIDRLTKAGLKLSNNHI